MNCCCHIPPMGDPRETLKQLCQEAAKAVSQDADLTERERGLLTCVLGIREFGRAVLRSMDDEDQVLWRIDKDIPAPVFVFPSLLWELVAHLTERILDGVGELERYDPDAAAFFKQIQSFQDSWEKDLLGHRRPD